MVRGQELTIATRAQVMLLHNMGQSQRQVATTLNISRCAVRRCISRSKEGDPEDFRSRKRSGRPKATSLRTDNAIKLMARRSPRSSSVKIQSQLPLADRISKQTIRRRLFNCGLKSRRPAKKPLLSKKNIRDRLVFCRKFKNWTADEWENVFFSDESTFTQFYAFTRQFAHSDP